MGGVRHCFRISGKRFYRLWHEYIAQTYIAYISQPKWHKRATLSDAKKPIKDIAFCPSHLGLKIACACMDGRVYIYEAQDVMNLSDWVLEVR
jgi:nucleoporin SEH1